MPELIKAGNDSDSKIRAAGLKALGETANVADLGALTDLLAKAKSADEISAVQEALESACARIPDKNACADKLLASLSSSATPAKCALLRVLVIVGTAPALDAVRSAVASQEAAVQDTAIRVLSDWPEPAALPFLMDVFRTTQDDGGSHRFLALRGCVRLLDLGGPPAEQVLKTYGELLSRTQRSDDRKVLLSGLGNVANPAALKLVEPFLSDTQVQAEAELAMLNIASGIAKSAPAEAKAVATRIQAESKSQAARDRAAKILSGLEKN
jgi:HEAT repeat protein